MEKAISQKRLHVSLGSKLALGVKFLRECLSLGKALTLTWGPQPWKQPPRRFLSPTAEVITETPTQIELILAVSHLQDVIKATWTGETQKRKEISIVRRAFDVALGTGGSDLHNCVVCDYIFHYETRLKCHLQ